MTVLRRTEFLFFMVFSEVGLMAALLGRTLAELPAVLRGKLKHLDRYLQRRKELAQRYDRMLADTSLSLPKVMAGNEHAYYLYVCRHPERDRIIEELKKRDVFVNISYPWPIHTMTGYQEYGYHEGDLPHTEKAATEIFSLPMYPSLTEDQLNIVINALKEILGSLE